MGKDAFQNPDFPLSGLLLDPQETSRELPRKNFSIPDVQPLDAKDFRLLGPLGSLGIPPANDVELQFRHRDWSGDRDRIRAALVAAGTTAVRVERFDNCGSDCMVEMTPDGKQARLRAFYCRDRWCKPCMDARAKDITEHILFLMDGKKCTFDTYTLAKDKRGLIERRRHLLESFQRLRDSRWWKDNVTGGIGSVQITLGKRKEHWHVHLHVLRDGPEWPESVQRKAWKKATGDSFVVDSRPVEDGKRAASYIARYAARGVEREVILCPDRLIESVVALRGARMLIPFGRWYGLDGPCRLDDQTEWRRVGRLERVAKDALAGQVYATGVIAALKVTVFYDGGKIKFASLKREEEETSGIDAEREQGVPGCETG